MANNDSRLLEMPGHLIRRLQQIAFALFLEQAKAFDFTPVQYAALFAINNNPGIDQTALCHTVALDRSTTADVVRRLEKKKLIRRVSGVTDRRTKSLHITAGGRRLIRQIGPSVAETQRLILAPLKPNQRGAFMQMLMHLVHLNNEHSRAPHRPAGSARPAARAAAPKRPARRRSPQPRARRAGRS